MPHFVRAKFDFKSEQADELDLIAGDVVQVVPDEEGYIDFAEWLTGTLKGGTRGIFPSSYVDDCEPPAALSPPHVHFEASPPLAPPRPPSPSSTHGASSDEASSAKIDCIQPLKIDTQVYRSTLQPLKAHEGEEEDDGGGAGDDVSVPEALLAITADLEAERSARSVLEEAGAAAAAKLARVEGEFAEYRLAAEADQLAKYEAARKASDREAALRDELAAVSSEARATVVELQVAYLELSDADARSSTARLGCKLLRDAKPAASIDNAASATQHKLEAEVGRLREEVEHLRAKAGSSSASFEHKRAAFAQQTSDQAAQINRLSSELVHQQKTIFSLDEQKRAVVPSYYRSTPAVALISSPPGVAQGPSSPLGPATRRRLVQASRRGPDDAVQDQASLTTKDRVQAWNARAGGGGGNAAAPDDTKQHEITKNFASALSHFEQAVAPPQLDTPQQANFKAARELFQGATKKPRKIAPGVLEKTYDFQRHRHHRSGSSAA